MTKIVIVDDMLPPSICESVITFFHKQREMGLTRHPANKGNTAYDIDENLLLFQKLFQLLEKNVHENYSDNIVVQRGQITEWTPGTSFGAHLDAAYKYTVLTSVTYLNDSYVGGETFIENDISIVPKIGRTVFYNGAHYKHGVKLIEKGDRYVMPVWYKIRNDCIN